MAWHYPPLEAFLTDEWKDKGCGCAGKKKMPKRGQKRSKPDEPACFGPHCGDAARAALRRLDATRREGPAAS